MKQVIIWLTTVLALAVPSHVNAQAGTCNAVPGDPHNCAAHISAKSL